MSLLLARNLRKFLEKSSAIQLSVKNQGRSDIMPRGILPECELCKRVPLNHILG